MADTAELSAFEAYELSKKEKKRRKKALRVENIEKLDGNVLKHVVPVNKRAMEVEENALWDNFVSDLHVKKKKKVDVSTPVSVPKSVFEKNCTSMKPVENVFLVAVSGKKKKKKSPKLPNSVKNVEQNEDDVNENAAVCPNGHPLLGKRNCKKCKKLKSAVTDVVSNPLLSSLSQQSTDTYIVDDTAGVSEKLYGHEKKQLPQCAKRSKNVEIHKMNGIGQSNNSSNHTSDHLQNNARENDSVVNGKGMLEWILSPVDVDTFFEDYWEKKPLHIARSTATYFDGIFSTKDLDRALRERPMYFGKNIDVTSYEDGLRTTENPEGSARPQLVWNLYNKGRSIRVLNPQTFIPNVGILVSSLQEFFKCMVGVNSYLTPAGTQGFAPHYDDIEAFVLQLEGEKHWKVYPPRDEKETLPRFSSPNFSQDEIGEPMLEVRLQPGDLLYFPRGFIHQARSVEEHHSLHITVSTYQCNTWYDLFQKGLPAALELAKDELLELREGLPLNFLNNMGLVHSDSESTERSAILEKISHLFAKLAEVCPWDAAADQIGKQFIHDSFPPPVFDDMDEGSWKKWMEKPKGSVKLVTANCLRLLSEEDTLFVYYNTDNSTEYHGEEPQGFEVVEEAGPVIEALIRNYPQFTKVKELQRCDGTTPQDVRQVLKQLASHSLLHIKQ